MSVTLGGWGGKWWRVHMRTETEAETEGNDAWLIGHYGEQVKIERYVLDILFGSGVA